MEVKEARKAYTKSLKQWERKLKKTELKPLGGLITNGEDWRNKPYNPYASGPYKYDASAKISGAYYV